MANNEQNNDMGKVPVHVSIIMDGNGRWARERGKERTYGHVFGVERVRDVTAAAAEAGVKYLSLYAFSEENWNRPEEEVQKLMGLMLKSVTDEMDNLMRNGVKFVVLGNRSRLGKDLDAAISRLEEITQDNRTLTLILFISYSGKWDILQAAKRMAAENGPEDIGSMEIQDFSKYLVTGGIPDPDLIIRTSGEQRISNYLLWQGAYSELIFTDTLWPDFGKEDFRKALEEYSLRDRRYGKVK